uniref:Precorrin-8X methylmutase n=1 Tax=Candidatus Kentrum sp. MB TaxID=2138164 RepID=A0A451BCF7_9GAMM|nr:MAG: precorrin-8X methylmutase [Candidatus Kentron sp. MB]VFK32533.1 MAG: precorrin-8X methylmutase [Candidatus Kentron sp. MB]VFK75969.1 MAG: precorrin-8X methylmutase [Candidatus Kentron sp. MB]
MITEQLTHAGRQIENDSFAIIDQEAGPHAYTSDQWPIVRRMIHATADFEFNGLTRFHPQAITAGIQAILAGRPIISDVEMIRVGLAKTRLTHFGIHVHQFIDDEDVIVNARQKGTTRATQSMRKAHEQGLVDGSIIAIGNAPTALLEIIRLVDEENARPALVIGMPVGFVSAAESKARLIANQVTGIAEVPWISIEGRKGGSTLVVAALHALLALAEAQQGK